MAANRTDQGLGRAEGICRERNVRLTPLRREVLAQLLQANKPLGAYELLELVRPAKAGVIAPPAVYRSLDFLLAQGLVHRLETSRAYVACHHPEHEHEVQFLICKQCGTAVEAEDARITDAAYSLGDRVGFQVQQLAVEITGVCANCRP